MSGDKVCQVEENVPVAEMWMVTPLTSRMKVRIRLGGKEISKMRSEW